MKLIALFAMMMLMQGCVTFEAVIDIPNPGGGKEPIGQLRFSKVFQAYDGVGKNPVLPPP